MSRLRQTFEALLFLLVLLGFAATAHVKVGKAPSWLTQSVDSTACLVAKRPLSPGGNCSSSS